MMPMIWGAALHECIILIDHVSESSTIATVAVMSECSLLGLRLGRRED